MDSSFTQDNRGFPFQKPLEPQAPARPTAFDSAPSTAGGPLRPFTAVDIAPPPQPGAAPSLAPAVSPFLEAPPRPFADAAAPAALLAPPPRAAFPAAKSLPEDDIIPALRPTLQTPARAQDMPASALDAARQSRILPAAPPEPAAGSAILPRFFLTSTASAEGHPIQAFLDILSVEVVVPKDLLFRNPAPYGELHRLKAAEDTLQRVKAKAMEELAEKARKAGADGVVGVQLSFVNLDTVCCLCSVVGTAVKL